MATPLLPNIPAVENAYYWALCQLQAFIPCTQGRINHGAKRAMAQGPHRKGAPRATKKTILGYLIFIYIGNQITDIRNRNTLRYVHDLMGILYAFRFQ